MSRLMPWDTTKVTKVHPSQPAQASQRLTSRTGKGYATPLAIIDQFTGRVWYRDKECQAGLVVVKGKEECLRMSQEPKTTGIINMDENHVVCAINNPETPQRVR